MIYTAKEYSKHFKFQGKYVSCSTIKRRCISNMLPDNHISRKLAGKTGAWVIEVPNENEDE